MRLQNGFPSSLKAAISAVLTASILAGSASFLFAQNALTPQEWKEDLDYLAKTVADKHRHAFDKVSRADFEKASAELAARLPNLADHEVIVGMARLVALLRDGHSRLNLPLPPPAAVPGGTSAPAGDTRFQFHRLPLQFYLFRGGLYIQAVAPDQREILGAKVLKIGKLPPDQAIEAVRPTISYDSENWIKEIGPQRLGLIEVLEDCGVTTGSAEVPLVLEQNGARRTVVLKPLPPGPEPAWLTWDSVPSGPKPLYLKDRSKPFWLEFLEPSRMLYVQINSIQDDKGETFGAFAGRLKDVIAARTPARVVLDLRWNGGGNNYLNRGLILALVASEEGNRYGRLFTIIGRATFSAAANLTTALEQWTETLFVGEPTGNSPSQYGDARAYTLPHSGLILRLSSVYWRDWSSDERRPWVSPDLKAEPSWVDYQAGRDPALEAILAYVAPESLLDQLKEKYQWNGLSAATNRYYHYRSSPLTAAVRVEQTLIDFGEYLFAQKHVSEAIDVGRYGLQEYPGSFGARLSLGKILIAAKKAKEAIEILTEALTLKPGDPEASALRQEAEKLGRRE